MLLPLRVERVGELRDAVLIHSVLLHELLRVGDGLLDQVRRLEVVLAVLLGLVLRALPGVLLHGGVRDSERLVRSLHASVDGEVLLVLHLRHLLRVLLVLAHRVEGASLRNEHTDGVEAGILLQVLHVASEAAAELLFEAVVAGELHLGGVRSIAGRVGIEVEGALLCGNVLEVSHGELVLGLGPAAERAAGGLHSVGVGAVHVGGGLDHLAVESVLRLKCNGSRCLNTSTVSRVR